jgi:hypothetical protein
MNPYAPPTELSHASPVPGSGIDVARLRAVARSHRLINLAILSNIATFVLVITASSLGDGRMAHVAVSLLGVLFLVVGAVSLFAAAWLAYALGGIAVAVLCSLLMFVPVLSLFMLVIMSQIATRRLRKAGCKVGLLGADLETLPS